MKRFAVTCGDPNGIGLEVAAKALHSLGPQRGAQFVLYRSKDSEISQLKRLKKKFQCVSVTSLSEIQSHRGNSKTLFDYTHSKAAPFWVQEAAEACVAKSFSGLITAPLSKTLIQQNGFAAAKGHTEILQAAAKVPTVHMAFVGEKFNVLLATGHLPLNQVSQALTASHIKKTLDHALQLRQILPTRLRKKPLAILGLNPHAGESGLLGKEELSLFHPLLAQMNKRDYVGPLAPDVAFLPSNWTQYSLYVCCYHDQGLIPFKLVHGHDSGYHLTFGLPFIRTSVDHGTAFDIFGKGLADPASMIDAIKACLQLTK